MLIQISKNVHDRYKPLMKIMLLFLAVLILFPISRCLAQSSEPEIIFEQDDTGIEQDDTGKEELEGMVTEESEEAVLEGEEAIPEGEESVTGNQDEAIHEMHDDDYHYNPAGKRDPFYSKLLEAKKKIEPNKKLFGVQRYDLAELNLVGIIWGDLGRKGVVETPEGKSYLVKVGTLIGKNGGIVKAITNQEVVVQEFVTDYLGNEIENITIIKIQRKEQEQ